MSFPSVYKVNNIQTKAPEELMDFNFPKLTGAFWLTSVTLYVIVMLQGLHLSTGGRDLFWKNISI